MKAHAGMPSMKLVDGDVDMPHRSIGLGRCQPAGLVF
jgi:hypothetical protein